MIRKVLCSAINYDHPQRGMLHAFRSLFGEKNVVDFDYYEKTRKGMTHDAINSDLVGVALNQRPDWIWLQVQDSNILQHKSILEIRKHLPRVVISHWTGDLRPAVSPYLADFCKACHLTLCSSTGQIPKFVEAGAPRVEYCQVAIDWEEDVLEDTVWAPSFAIPEVLFIGNNYGKIYPGTADRENAIVALMQANLPIGIVGSGWGPGFPVIGTCKLKEQIHLWRRAKVGLSISNFSDIGQYYSDRQLVSMASGTPIITKSFPGIEKEFSDDETVRYAHARDLPEYVKDLLGDEKKRMAMGRKARRRILSDHTWFNRFTSLLPVVEEIRSTLP